MVLIVPFLYALILLPIQISVAAVVYYSWRLFHMAFRGVSICLSVSCLFFTLYISLGRVALERFYLLSVITATIANRDLGGANTAIYWFVVHINAV